MKVRISVAQERGRRTLRWLFLTVGFVCLGVYFYSYLYRTGFQLYEGWKFDREAQEPKSVAPTPIRRRKHAALPVVLPDPDRATKEPEAGILEGIIGRISIPRLHISAIVQEGVDEDTLARAVGHIPGTALPGEDGNIGIAGHRDTFFRGLKDLQPHDQIDFTTHSGHYHYKVESLRVVEPDDVGVLKPQGENTLTIVTCFPFHYIGSAPRRFIVHAVLE